MAQLSHPRLATRQPEIHLHAWFKPLRNCVDHSDPASRTEHAQAHIGKHLLAQGTVGAISGDHHIGIHTTAISEMGRGVIGMVHHRDALLTEHEVVAHRGRQGL